MMTDFDYEYSALIVGSKGLTRNILAFCSAETVDGRAYIGDF